MRLKALLAICALALAAACTSTPTGPSTSQAPSVEYRADGVPTMGSGG